MNASNNLPIKEILHALVSLLYEIELINCNEEINERIKKMRKTLFEYSYSLGQVTAIDRIAFVQIDDFVSQLESLGNDLLDNNVHPFFVYQIYLFKVLLEKVLNLNSHLFTWFNTNIFFEKEKFAYSVF